MSRKSYVAGLARRLGPRSSRSIEESYQHNWSRAGLRKDEVLELLHLLETIYRVPAGTLEPDDCLEVLTGPVQSRSWWRDNFHDLYAGDNEAWLGEELEKKLRTHGIEGEIEAVRTIDALVRVWCGVVP